MVHDPDNLSGFHLEDKPTKHQQDYSGRVSEKSAISDPRLDSGPF